MGILEDNVQQIVCIVAVGSSKKFGETFHLLRVAYSIRVARQKETVLICFIRV